MHEETDEMFLLNGLQSPNPEKGNFLSLKVSCTKILRCFLCLWNPIGIAGGGPRIVHLVGDHLFFSK